MKERCFLKGFQASPLCPFGYRNMLMKMQHCCIGTELEKQMFLEDMPQNCFVPPYKFHIDWPGIKPESPQ